MPDFSRKLFVHGDYNFPVDTITMATGETELLSKEFIEPSQSTTERVFFMDCADDDSQTPTIKVEASLTFDEGITWSDWFEIESASAVPKQIQVTSYDSSWWIRNTGAKFKVTKAGAGAVTITKARWI